MQRGEQGDSKSKELGWVHRELKVVQCARHENEKYECSYRHRDETKQIERGRVKHVCLSVLEDLLYFVSIIVDHVVLTIT